MKYRGSHNTHGILSVVINKIPHLIVRSDIIKISQQSLGNEISMDICKGPCHVLSMSAFALMRMRWRPVLRSELSG